jgi:hypothetical protein
MTRVSSPQPRPGPTTTGNPRSPTAWTGAPTTPTATASPTCRNSFSAPRPSPPTARWYHHHFQRRQSGPALAATQSGATYSLTQSATLAADSWLPAGPPAPAPDTDQSGAPDGCEFYQATIPANAGKRFLRIEGREN